MAIYQLPSSQQLTVEVHAFVPWEHATARGPRTSGIFSTSTASATECNVLPIDHPRSIAQEVHPTYKPVNKVPRSFLAEEAYLKSHRVSPTASIAHHSATCPQFKTHAASTTPHRQSDAFAPATRTQPCFMQLGTHTSTTYGEYRMPR